MMDKCVIGMMETTGKYNTDFCYIKYSPCYRLFHW